MKMFLTTCFLFVLIFFGISELKAWEDMPTPRLKVEGRYLKDPHGNIINLHGFAQTYSPWFNERGTKWSNYNVNGCLTYNQGLIDEILAAGWKMSFIRLHMDPYWSNTPGCTPHAHELPNCFNVTRFIKYLDEVFIPMAEYAISKGLYVVMRPPGVAPEVIGVEDDYNYAQYLMTVWDIVSNHPKIKNRDEIMFELANEPVRIRLADGSEGANTQAHFDVLKEIFQPIVNRIRENGFHNVLWIPGSGYQAHYKGFAVNPIEGDNIGYAVHIYPGWFGSANGYDVFKREWDEQVKPIADIAPILITEMDWAPEKYNSSWGKGITGAAGGEGFGANFKKIMDDTGNAGWLLFTEPHLLAQFTGEPPATGQPYTFLNDPEACPWPIYHWYLEYAEIYEPRPDFEHRSISDNGDGTFSNPVIAGNFPAPGLLTNNGKYYMVSSDPHFSPNSIILESMDLVNWQYSNVTIDDLPIENIRFVDESNVHAGSLIETGAGEWWAIVSYKSGPLGHFPNLLPVELVNENFVIDESAINGINIQKPNVGNTFPLTALATNDNFRHWSLSPQWGWFGVPDDESWSLLERAGYLRLTTVNVTDDMSESLNIITQRILSYPQSNGLSFATVRMETDNMVDGDVAGLSIFHEDFAYVGLEVTNGEKKLITFINDEKQTGALITEDSIFLRAVVDNNLGNVKFYYSQDNSTYTQLGADYVLDDSSFGPFSGYRFGIFNYATIETGGYVDIDWFSTESDFSEENFYPLNFEGYTEESLTLTDMYIDEGDEITVLTKSSKRLVVKAVFADGRIQDVGMEALYTNGNPDVINVNKGMIRSFKDGESELVIDYTGPLGHQYQITTNLHSTTFPLTNEFFNPNVWENGTFDETTKTLQTGQWGFGGWQYDGIDLSDYKYIVVRLGSNNTANADFRLFDETSYWSSPAIFSFGNSRELVVVLEYAKKGNGAFLNSNSIYIAGFWSNGSNPFIIDTVFLSNSSEYDPPVIFVNGVGGTETLALSGFNYELGAGPSEIQEFKISAELLKANVAFSTPTGFEISLNPESGYVRNLSISQSDGVVAETSIYIRLRSGLAVNTYTGNLIISSTGAYSRTVSVTGLVEQNPTSIHEPDAPVATVIREEFYSLTGQQVLSLNNLSGVFIVKQYLSDGTISTIKVVKKR